MSVLVLIGGRCGKIKRFESMRAAGKRLIPGTWYRERGTSWYYVHKRGEYICVSEAKIPKEIMLLMMICNLKN